MTGAQRSSEEDEDLAHAGAIASLPLMTPQRLRRLLHDRPAAEVWAELRLGHPSVAVVLREMSSFSGGVSRRTGGPDRRPLVIEDIVGEWRRVARRLDVPSLWSSFAERQIEVVRSTSSRYPERLGPDGEAPEVLFAHGDLAVADGPTVAIVGTRRATHYGMEVAAEMASGLAAGGVCVISGLAAGIDGAAHEGALATGRDGGDGPAPGRPLGVVGGGIDVFYPARNRRLIERVAEAGVLISEAPPGESPEPWRFPLRNRIIAALAQVVVVVESSRAGGSMHTVEAALRRGREVFAVPGSVRSPSSEGTNELLAAGAHVARDATDVLVAVEQCCVAEGIALPRRRRGQSARSNEPARLTGEPLAVVLRACSQEERQVYAALDEHVVTLDTVCERAGVGVGSAALALDQLFEAGLALPADGGWRRR
jgi:DNA processing protein